MKKSDMIRSAMRNGAATRQAIIDGSGVDANYVSTWLSQRVAPTCGEVKRTEVDSGFEYTLVEDFKPAARTAAATPPRARKSAKKKKAPRRAGDRQKLREIAANARKAAPAGDVRHLALKSYRALGASLRDHIRNVVDDIASDPVLCMLLEHHENAEQLVDATGPH